MKQVNFVKKEGKALLSVGFSEVNEDGKLRITDEAHKEIMDWVAENGVDDILLLSISSRGMILDSAGITSPLPGGGYRLEPVEHKTVDVEFVEGKYVQLCLDTTKNRLIINFHVVGETVQEVLEIASPRDSLWESMGIHMGKHFEPHMVIPTRLANEIGNYFKFLLVTDSEDDAPLRIAFNGIIIPAYTKEQNVTFDCTFDRIELKSGGSKGVCPRTFDLLPLEDWGHCLHQNEQNFLAWLEEARNTLPWKTAGCGIMGYYEAVACCDLLWFKRHNLDKQIARLTAWYAKKQVPMFNNYAKYQKITISDNYKKVSDKFLLEAEQWMIPHQYHLLQSEWERVVTSTIQDMTSQVIEESKLSIDGPNVIRFVEILGLRLQRNWKLLITKPMTTNKGYGLLSAYLLGYLEVGGEGLSWNSIVFKNMFIGPTGILMKCLVAFLSQKKIEEAMVAESSKLGVVPPQVIDYNAGE